MATLEFAGVEDLELEEFGAQNVLFDLVLCDLDKGVPSAAALQVELPSSNGLDGAFRCQDVTVLAAEPFVAGPHSVYSR